MKNTLLLCAGMLVFIGSCKKPDTTPTVVSTYPTYSSLDTIYQMLEVKPKYVTVNGATGGTFYGTSGTRYVIPPNCLQDASGNPITTNVQFEVAEYLKKGDMIFSKMLPISDGKPLLSGGQLSINATLGGQQIYLKPSGCTFSATFPRDKDTVSGMEFFAGQEVSNPDDYKVNWKRPDTAVRDGFVVYNGDTITLVSDSFHYANVDKFLPFEFYSRFQDFTITISISGKNTIDASTNIRGIALIDNYKASVRQNHGNMLLTTQIEGSEIPDIPVHFVFYGLVDGRFYAGVTAATPKTGENYTVTLTETDPAGFKAQLNNLTK